MTPVVRPWESQLEHGAGVSADTINNRSIIWWSTPHLMIYGGSGEHCNWYNQHARSCTAGNAIIIIIISMHPPPPLSRAQGSGIQEGYMIQYISSAHSFTSDRLITIRSDGYYAKKIVFSWFTIKLWLIIKFYFPLGPCILSSLSLECSIQNFKE